MLTLQDIWNSSTGLLKRFDLTPTLDASWAKVIEESAELSEALYDLRERPKNDLFRSAAACEMADTIVTLINLLYGAGLTFEDMDKRPSLSLIFNLAPYKLTTPRFAWVNCMLCLVNARLSLDSLRNASATKFDVVTDLFACITTLFSVAKHAGLTFDEIERALESTMLKNDAKNSSTHEVRDGQIKKLKPVIAEE